MHRHFFYVVCFLTAITGCSSSTAIATSKAAQTIRTDGLYRAVQKRGENDKGATIYLLTFIRFLPNKQVHLATSEGIFDVERKTKQVAEDGFLSDSKLDNEGSVGTWSLTENNVLEFELKWKMRGRWIGPEGRKTLELTEDGEEFHISEKHTGTVDGETIEMSAKNDTFQTTKHYSAKFVPINFTKPGNKQSTIPAGR